MKVVKQMFFDDVKHIAKNFFALALTLGICVLPALYAWFNIYSNWDPYGNTGALKIAAISLDKGYNNDGEYTNVGKDVIEDLKENTSVDWQFVQTEEQAINGVYDGTYYAAVVIGEDFTYNMYNVFAEDASEPTLVFYQNQKKNPVATKISDTVVGNLEKKINEAFIEVVVNEVFANVNEAYEVIEEQGGVDGALEKLDSINEQLIKYQFSIEQTIKANSNLSASLKSAKQDTVQMSNQANEGAAEMDRAVGQLRVAQTSVKDFKGTAEASLDEIVKHLESMENTLDKEKNSNTKEVIDELGAITAAAALCKKDCDDINKILEELYANNVISSDSSKNPIITNTDATAQFEANWKQVNDYVNKIYAESTAGEKDILALQKAIPATIQAIAMTKDITENVVIPALDESMDSLADIMTQSATMMRSISNTMIGLGNVCVALDNTVGSANVSLEKTDEALTKIIDKLTDLSRRAHAATEDERMDIIINTLTGDPDVYGKFFSEPVQIETNTMYPVENYGSAVTPFYTTLAIWVGGLILCAIIKVHPKKKNYPDATPVQLFFGRYALFFVCAQLQAAIIVFGNLAVFKVQCVHPGWFWFASSVAATTFSLLIYSLVLSFGDVGKAIAVVVVVLQIAGSSGTYPIELLPEFFQKVYIFFPFPYAINAMRECTCGMYEADFLVYILKLMCFIVASLVIGLLIRVPFEELNHFFEERMEDTEMM